MSSPVAENLLTQAAVEQLSRSKNEPEWLLEKRLGAWKQYEELPVPDWTRGIRGWWNSAVKGLHLEALLPYTPAGKNLPDLELDTFNQVQEDDEDGEEGVTVTESTAGLLVQYNSEVVRVELSEKAQAAGIIFTSLDEAVQKYPDLVQKYFMSKNVLSDEHKFTALHAALWSGGAFLYVPKNVELEDPFRVVFYADIANAAIFSHVLVVTEANTKVKVVEEQRSDPAVTTQMLDANVVETFVGRDSLLEFYNPQEWGENVYNFSVKRAKVSNNSLNRWIMAVLGSDETRLDLETINEGEGSRAETFGAIFPTHTQHLDIKSLTKHTVPHTSGDALFKAALSDKGEYGFQGKIRVDKPARHTDSFLMDHVLFLSEDAKAAPLPSLDVDANEVRCSHGQTIGMVDEQQIFYMQSRGLTREQASALIVAGFFQGVIDRIPLPSIRQRLRESIARKMA